MTLFTFIFLLGGIQHIAGNMPYPWIFENNVEDSMERFGLTYSTFYAVVLPPIRMSS
jgi:membrane associated rhomboid family serine protease